MFQILTGVMTGVADAGAGTEGGTRGHKGSTEGAWRVARTPEPGRRRHGGLVVRGGPAESR
jgi:hypothetical protein